MAPVMVCGWQGAGRLANSGSGLHLGPWLPGCVVLAASLHGYWHNHLLTSSSPQGQGEGDPPELTQGLFF